MEPRERASIRVYFFKIRPDGRKERARRALVRRSLLIADAFFTAPDVIF